MRLMSVVSALLVLWLAVPPAHAFQGAGSAPVDETEPVAVPEPSEAAVAYYTSGNLLWVVDQAWSMLVLVVLLATGLSAAPAQPRAADGAEPVVLRARRLLHPLHADHVDRRSAARLLRGIRAAARVRPVEPDRPEVVDRHAHRPGAGVRRSVRWSSGCPICCSGRARRAGGSTAPSRSCPFIIVGNLVAPIWIAPLFNRFGPMQDKALEAQILALADRAGIEGSRVFEVEKSVDTKTINAYVAGVFNTKRIVLWDTIVKRMNERELLFVMGHEMAHFVLGHTWQLIVLNTVLLIASFYAAYRMAGAVLRRYGDRFGFSRMDDFASLPLLLLLVSVVLAGRHAGHPGVHAAHGARGRSLRAGDHAVPTTARRRRSSRCRPTCSRCRGPGCSTCCGGRATRRSASASTSPTTITPGARGQPLVYGDRFKAQRVRDQDGQGSGHQDPGTRPKPRRQNRCCAPSPCPPDASAAAA